MLLDDEIVEIVLAGEPYTTEEISPLLTKLFDRCITHMLKDINASTTDFDLFQIIKRGCKSWDSACDILKEKGYPLLKHDGLKKYLMQDPDLAKLIKAAFDK